MLLAGVFGAALLLRVWGIGYGLPNVLCRPDEEKIVGPFEWTPNINAYGPSKAAVINMTRSLAVEWAGYTINVNCVAPI